MASNLGAIAREIVCSRNFDRIRDISFLGIVDLFHTNRKVGMTSSRADHTLAVVKLAALAAKHISLPEEEAAYLIAASLVHDIGHSPFSHSLEYAFPKERRCWDHHRAVKKVLLEPHGTDRQVQRAIHSHGLSPDRLVSILDGEDPLSFFFFAPINIDTIEGISRSFLSFRARPKYNVLSLTYFIAELYAGEVVADEKLLWHADIFWKSKEAFYSLIDSQKDVARAERHFQEAVRRQIDVLSEEYFRMTEKQFTSRHPQVMSDAAELELVDAPRSRQQFRVNREVKKIDKNSMKERYVRKRRPA
jgi:HD superfamily phosphohydrolase